LCPFILNCRLNINNKYIIYFHKTFIYFYFQNYLSPFSFTLLPLFYFSSFKWACQTMGQKKTLQTHQVKKKWLVSFKNFVVLIIYNEKMYIYFLRLIIHLLYFQSKYYLSEITDKNYTCYNDLIHQVIPMANMVDKLSIQE
jgi:hypothetical protein